MFAGLFEKDVLDYWGRQSTRRSFEVDIKDVSSSQPVRKSMLNRRIGEIIMLNRTRPKNRAAVQIFISKTINVVQVNEHQSRPCTRRISSSYSTMEKVEMIQKPACLNVIDKSE